MNNSYTDLFKSIRTKCEEEGWFGPDNLNPHPYEDVEYDSIFDQRTVNAILPDDPRRFHFAFPPTTAEQIHETEKQLGFAIPSLLQALYVQIANGGFGPETGLRGAYEGYGSIGNGLYPEIDDTISGSYQRQFESHGRTIDLTKYEGKWTTRKELVLPHDGWPQYLLPICNLGCGQEACVDIQEQMFLVAPVREGDCFWKLPWTFEEWLWRWVRDEELLPRY